MLKFYWSRGLMVVFSKLERSYSSFTKLQGIDVNYPNYIITWYLDVSRKLYKTRSPNRFGGKSSFSNSQIHLHMSASRCWPAA